MYHPTHWVRSAGDRAAFQPQEGVHSQISLEVGDQKCILELFIVNRCRLTEVTRQRFRFGTFSSNPMRRPLIFIAILLVALVALRLYSQSTEFFQDGGSASGPQVIIAKAEWCGHCKAAAPEFKKLQDASPIRLKDGRSATVKILDADSDKDEINSLPVRVRGYPTILIMNGAQATEFPGERTAKAVEDALNML